jgi:hypothetical protein
MMARSFAEALEDSVIIADIATRAGLSPAQVKRVAAAFGDLPAEQVVRLCGTAAAERLREKNRETRKGDRR